MPNAKSGRGKYDLFSALLNPFQQRWLTGKFTLWPHSG